MNLKQYNVTVRCFNPDERTSRGQIFILPVDSPDEEHAISAAMSNCIVFTTKSRLGVLIDIAFQCIDVSRRQD
ncbi:hypothetical protein [Terriglobus sp.]|uniref:hypothetical protein n=1 Tax=Terriglobus sp. TaxID=1889013 RepID=UPI003AFFF526